MTADQTPTPNPQESLESTLQSSTKMSTLDTTCSSVESQSSTIEDRIQTLQDKVCARDPHEPEFLQAVEEVLVSLRPAFVQDPTLLGIFERLAEPERTISFRVPWTADDGSLHVNRGFRVQYSSALGPYKGGLRFHPTVNQGVLKFLGFEQIFKNSLTTLPLGAAKGGSDFDPKGKSDREVFEFCKSFMTELHKHIGAWTDVPAGDIGVGAREIGYLYGAYKKLSNKGGEQIVGSRGSLGGSNLFPADLLSVAPYRKLYPTTQGVLTGKHPDFGGSLIRPEATGYGTVYFAEHCFHKFFNKGLASEKVAVSGSGNVAQFAVEKLLDLGAIPVTMSDSRGTLYVPDGITRPLLEVIKKVKNEKRASLATIPGADKTFVNPFLPFVVEGCSVFYYANDVPWNIVDKCTVALPCATQNELHDTHVERLSQLGSSDGLQACFALKLVVEGANMPSTKAAIELMKKNNIIYGPAKAANAGGVAVSGLEMAQNHSRMAWTRETVDETLQTIMKKIFENCVVTAQEYGLEEKDLQAGANIAGFAKVARAMRAQGFY